jgi:hypothetical protein
LILIFWDQFARHQERLSQYINDLDGINIAIASPASKFIVYTLDKALDIITTHEKRHLEQARELAGLLKSVQPLRLTRRILVMLAVADCCHRHLSVLTDCTTDIPIISLPRK